MSCSEYDFLERAHLKAAEEVDRIRVFTESPRSASNMDALIGAELTKSIIDAARDRHLHSCNVCIHERWHGPVHQHAA